MRDLFPPDWIKSDGTRYKYGASLPVGTYYAKIDLQGSDRFGGTFVTDGVTVATATVDGNDLPITEASFYGATGGATGWTDCANVPDTTIAAGATLSFALGGTGSVLDFEQSSARIHLVVATQGPCTFYPTNKGC